MEWSVASLASVVFPTHLTTPRPPIPTRHPIQNGLHHLGVCLRRGPQGPYPILLRMISLPETGTRRNAQFGVEWAGPVNGRMPGTSPLPGRQASLMPEKGRGSESPPCLVNSLPRYPCHGRRVDRGARRLGARRSSLSVRRPDRWRPRRRRAAARFAGLLGACPQTPGDFPLWASSMVSKEGNARSS